jgi:putative transcriptional regulator
MEPVSPEELAKRLKEARVAAGLTQAELADAVGVAQSAICGWENGDYEPGRALWKRIADACHTDVVTLFLKKSPRPRRPAA